MSVPLIKTLIVGLLPFYVTRVRGVTVLLAALWKAEEKLLVVLLCFTISRKRIMLRGFASFCFSETVNLRVMICYYNRFGQVSERVCVCVCALNERRLRWLENAKLPRCPSLGMISTFGCAGAGHSWRTSRCHDSYPLLSHPPLPSLCLSSSFAKCWWLGNGCLVLTAFLTSTRTLLHKKRPDLCLKYNFNLDLLQTLKFTSCIKIPYEWLDLDSLLRNALWMK